MRKVAVVLFNLGGPDSRAAVAPFLYNLFSDPAIIALPNPFRTVLAKLIAYRRASVARAIYARIGDASPIVSNTEAQARALETELGSDFRVFVAMRYWAPLSEAAAGEVRDWGPDQIVLLPLYPQFSTTTTESSLRAWQKAAEKIGLVAPTHAICCYPAEWGFVTALAEQLDAARSDWQQDVPLRVLLSAHGLPKRIVERGDPYQWQVETTAAALRARAGDDVDVVVCYQSRVGPLRWLEPATDAEIRRAGADGVGLIVLPIAFVSEHSETLVELDLEYGHLARSSGVPRYVRAPVVAIAAPFIEGLAALVRQAAHGQAIAPAGGRRICPSGYRRCPCRREEEP